MSDFNMEDKIDKKPQKSEESALGITAFVFGILSIAANFVSLPLGMYFPFAGVILSVCDKTKNKVFTKFGKAGLICSIIGYAISAVISLMLAFLLVIYILIFIAIAFSIALMDSGALA
ncbi:MAG: hypothetical protein IJD89_06160 [Clostridia bacterium]|nr:hypothetical protein [Clostridia bacterium]